MPGATSIDKPDGLRMKRRSHLLRKITFNLSKGYYNFVYQMIKDKCANINEQPLANNWLQLETSKTNKEFLEGKTPLILCSFIKEHDVRMNMARMLIENSAKLSLFNVKNGCNALHYACALLCFDLVEYFLNSIDFDLNLTDYNGNTPLFYFISSLYLIKLNDKELNSALKLLDLYLQSSKRYSFPINIENKFGLNLLNLCKLLGNKDIYQMVKNSVNESIPPHYKPNKVLQDDTDDLHKEELLFENIETLSIKNTQTINSRPSTNCSFLDEIVNFKKWSKPLIKSSKFTERKMIDANNISKLRTHSSTPIIRVLKAESQTSDELKLLNSNNVAALAHQNFLQRGKEQILKKHLLIDINEIKYKRLEYAKEADEKLVKIYMNRLLGEEKHDVYCLNHNKNFVIVKQECKQNSNSGKGPIKIIHSTNSLTQIASSSNEIKIYRSKSAIQIVGIEEKSSMKALEKSKTSGKSVKTVRKKPRPFTASVVQTIKKTERINAKLLLQKTEEKKDTNQHHLQQFQQQNSLKVHSMTELQSQIPLLDNFQSSHLFEESLNKQIKSHRDKRIEQSSCPINKPKRIKRNAEKSNNWKNEFHNFYDNIEIACSKSYRKASRPVICVNEPPEEEINEPSSIDNTLQHAVASSLTSGSRSSGWIYNNHNHNHIHSNK